MTNDKKTTGQPIAEESKGTIKDVVHRHLQDANHKITDEEIRNSKPHIDLTDSRGLADDIEQNTEDRTITPLDLLDE